MRCRLIVELISSFHLQWVVKHLHLNALARVDWHRLVRNKNHSFIARFRACTMILLVDC